MFILIGAVLGCVVYVIATCFYVVNPDQRAVKTIFGKAVQTGRNVELGLAGSEADWYEYPDLKIIQPGLHLKAPWEKVHKVNIATQVVNMAFDPENPKANNQNQALDVITRDSLDIDLTGQIRFRVSELNIYAYLFGVKNPMCYVMGYFSALLREKVANFEQQKSQITEGEELDVMYGAGSVSINDIRKNLRGLNNAMEEGCRSSEARYGVVLEASLITGLSSPDEVEQALAAINTAHNAVSSDISVAQAKADEVIVESKRAVEIATLQAQTETENIRCLYEELKALHAKSPQALKAYVRNVKLTELDLAKTIYKCSGRDSQ
jgi:regulator of protease activity HflC (stomatin/prohibitin superfamily)